MSFKNGRLQCDMDLECKSLITHIDEKGFIYCAPHGIQRKGSHACRKLTATELRTLTSGKPIHYRRVSVPRRLKDAAPELLKTLKELVARCDGDDGVRADGSNIETIQAHALIERLEND